MRERVVMWNYQNGPCFLRKLHRHVYNGGSGKRMFIKYFSNWNHRRNVFIEWNVNFLFIFIIRYIFCSNDLHLKYFLNFVWEAWYLEYTMPTWLTRVVAFLLTYCRVISKKARLELIKEASHVPQIEKPEEFNNIILNFLQPKSWLFFSFFSASHDYVSYIPSKNYCFVFITIFLWNCYYIFKSKIIL